MVEKHWAICRQVNILNKIPLDWYRVLTSLTSHAIPSYGHYQLCSTTFGTPGQHPVSRFLCIRCQVIRLSVSRMICLIALFAQLVPSSDRLVSHWPSILRTIYIQSSVSATQLRVVRVASRSDSRIPSFPSK